MSRFPPFSYIKHIQPEPLDKGLFSVHVYLNPYPKSQRIGILGFSGDVD